MTVALARRPATPYARRLARERGFALAEIAGTGPDSRIVAADVEAFARRPAVAAPGAASPSVAVSAFAMTVDLANLRRLLADFATAQVAVTLDAMLVRAIALALEAGPGLAGATTGWETGAGADRRELLLPEAHNGLVSALQARLATALSNDGSDGAAAHPTLSIRRIRQAGVRPAVLPLLAGHTMRLVVIADDAAPTAECLLCFDDAIGEDAAAAVLARFRDGIEMPIRLLA